MSRFMFKFRSGMHGLHEELGRHQGREGTKECLLCHESVSHVYGNVQHIVVSGTVF